MVKANEDLTGKIFGRLKVLKQVDDYVSPRGIHMSRWLCECNCENHTIKEINGYNLTKTYKPTRSCGCLNRDINQNKNFKQNKYDISDEFGILWTTNTNEEVYFDLDDADIILSHCWHKDAFGYAVTNIRKENGKRTQVKMHSMLGYYYPDHNDRNKLNNRRSNLIPCTASENLKNRNLQSNNTSGIIGVTWNKQNKTWTARINIDKQRVYLGDFADKDDAIKARLSAEKQYYKEFSPQRHLFEQYEIN